MDSEFADGNGKSAVIQIRKNESTTFFLFHFTGENKLEPSVICSLSGNSIQTQQNEYKGQNITHFFLKPVNTKEFLRIMKHFI